MDELELSRLRVDYTEDETLGDTIPNYIVGWVCDYQRPGAPNCID